MLRQVLAHPKASKNDVGVLLLQFIAHGAVAHQHQLDVGVLQFERAVAVNDGAQVFFCCQAAHINHHPVLFCGAPDTAQLRLALCWRKQPGVNAARHHRQALKAAARQLAFQGGGRHHGGVRRVMKLFHVRQNRAAQPANAVVLAVGVEIGPKVGTDGQLELARHLQRGPAQRPFGGDVHDVGPLAGPQPQQFALGRQPQAQLPVKRNGQAPHQQLLVAAVDQGHVHAGLARAHQPDHMATGLQALHDLGQGVGHAVDVGWIGLGHHRDVQRGLGVADALDQKLWFGIHGTTVPPLCDRFMKRQ